MSDRRESTDSGRVRSVAGSSRQSSLNGLDNEFDMELDTEQQPATASSERGTICYGRKQLCMFSEDLPLDLLDQGEATSIPSERG
jgi:hypothetical protein